MSLSAISTALSVTRTFTTGKLIVYGAAIALLMASAAGGYGMYIGYDYGSSKGKAEVAKIQARSAEAVAQAQEQARQKYEDETRRANTAERKLLEAQRRFAGERKTLLRRINDVSTVYQPTPGAEPVALPRSVFTIGWVQLYNEAIGLPGIQTPAAAASAGSAPATGAAVDTRLRESGVNQRDILAHIAEYGERCRGLEKQVTELLEIYEGKGKAEP